MPWSTFPCCLLKNASVERATHSPLPFNCFNRVIMEYGGYDLGKIIKHSRKLAGWSELHVRFISWQILAGLNYLHSANIAHRVRHGGRGYDSKQYLTVPTWLDLSALTVTTYASDLLPAALLYAQDLKPSSILVTEDNHVSLIDFGLARQLTAMGDGKKGATNKDEYAKPQNKNLAMSRKLTQHVVSILFAFGGCQHLALLLFVFFLRLI